jgi:uncharacterized repeat protein (TIGR01451 family)
MASWLAFFRVLLPLAILVIHAAAQAQSPTTELPVSTDAAFRVNTAYGRMPVEFEENIGQTDARIRFMARGRGYTLFLTGTETVAVLQNRGPRMGDRRHPEKGRMSAPSHVDAAAPDIIRMRLHGAALQPTVRGERPLGGKSNYFIGSDPSTWRTSVAHYAQVRVGDVYPGIDVVFYGNQGQIEYDFVIAPGADPGHIRLSYDGADRIDVDRAGDLVLHVKGGELRQPRPLVYQDRGGTRHAVRAAYRRLGTGDFGIAIGTYDSARPLMIDPTLVFSTYLGGADNDFCSHLAIDKFGSAYVTGCTASIDFPVANPFQAQHNGSWTDVFVAKLNPSGSALDYSTYLGGRTATAFRPGEAVGQYGNAIAVDGSGNAYVTGGTGTSDFPLLNPLQATKKSAHYTAFVTKLNPSGSALLYSTYLGGSGDDEARGMAIDTAGNAYVTGVAGSTDFPTASAFQANKLGSVDAFITKLNPSGSALVYSTYLGGTESDWANGIAVDISGSAYITGHTRSNDFPVQSPLQAHGFGEDAFVTKLNASGSALVYSTYLSGSCLTGALWGNEGWGIVVDSGGNAYVTGATCSVDFPTVNPIQAHHDAHDFDGFVAKLNAPGSALVYSTYLGGTGSDEGQAVAVDNAGHAYVVGRTFSADFPTANPLPGTSFRSGDAYVAKLNGSGGLVYSTYLGGSDVDIGEAVAVDVAENVYVSGITRSADFPTVNPFQASQHSLIHSYNNFIVKLSAVTTNLADMTIAKTRAGNFVRGQDRAIYTISVSNIGLGPSSGLVTVTDLLPAGLTATMSGSGWTCPLGTLTCTRSDVLASGGSYPPITVTASVSVNARSVSNSAIVSGGGETNTTNNTATDVATIDGPAIPALDRRTLIALAVLLAALGTIFLRK